jgi:biotin transporter BioY
LEGKGIINIWVLAHIGFILGFIVVSIGFTILLVKKKRERRVGIDALVTLGACAMVMAIGSAVMVFDLLRYLGMA